MFKTFNAHAVVKAGETWNISDNHSTSLTARHIHATTSCGLQKQALGRYHLTAQSEELRGAAVVDIAIENVGLSQTYAAFWRDPDVSRISRIDHPGIADSCLRFLIELRNPETLDSPQLPGILRKRLEVSHILRPGLPFTLIGPVVCKATQNADQLPQGTIEPGFTTYYSNGNLAAGIARWMRTQLPGQSACG